MTHKHSSTQAENPSFPEKTLAKIRSSLEERKSKQPIHKFAYKLIKKTGMHHHEIDIAAGRECSAKELTKYLALLTDYPEFSNMVDNEDFTRALELVLRTIAHLDNEEERVQADGKEPPMNASNEDICSGFLVTQVFVERALTPRNADRKVVQKLDLSHEREQHVRHIFAEDGSWSGIKWSKDPEALPNVYPDKPPRILVVAFVLKKIRNSRDTVRVDRLGPCKPPVQLQTVQDGNGKPVGFLRNQQTNAVFRLIAM